MNDPFGRSRLPGDFSRAGRVRLLREAFDDLMRGQMPSDEARVFLAAGGMAWLTGGGSLERDYWRVAAPKGSHHTPARLLIAMSDTDDRSSETGGDLTTNSESS